MTTTHVYSTRLDMQAPIEHLANGNIRVNGLEIERPPTTWAMPDAAGNPVVGKEGTTRCLSCAIPHSKRRRT